MDYLKEIYNQNKRILAALEKNKQWVKWPVVAQLTGWKKEQFRVKRDNGSIEWKRDKKGMWYNIDSVNQIHHKIQTA